MLTLYDFPESVCCQKVRLALAEAGVRDVKEVRVSLDQGDQFAPEFQKLNPKGVVPVLTHDDKVIAESTIISEYLDVISDGPSLMPTDPYWRSRKQYWSMQVDRQIHNPHTTILSFVVALRFAFLDSLDTPEKVEKHLAAISDPLSREMQRQGLVMGYDAPAFQDAVIAFDALLTEMGQQLGESEFLAGDSLSLADLDLAPYVHRLESLQLTGMWRDRPNVARWYNALKQRPSWHNAIEERHDPKWVELMSVKGRDAQAYVDEILAK